MIKLVDVSKIYNTNGTTAIGIQNVSLEFNIGEFVAITGESGAGKSTLLNVVSGYDTYEEGAMYVGDQDVTDFTKEEFDNYRSKYVSFIFQDYNLIDSYTVLENVMLPLLANGVKYEEAKKRAEEIISEVGLKDRIHSRGTKLSGGEKQRCVIARALVSESPVLACDEPTGNLDSKTSKEIVQLIAKYSKNHLILYVTHDFNSIKDYATRKITFKDSKVVEDIKLKKLSENNTIELVEKKKINFFRKFAISFKNIIKTPNRTILNFLILFLSSIGICLSTYGMFNSITSLFNQGVNYQTNFAYPNAVTNRVVAKQKSGNTVSLSSELSSYDFVDKGNIFSDSKLNISYYKNDDTKDIIAANLFGCVNSDVSLVTGRAPTGENEIALCYYIGTNEKSSTVLTIKNLVDSKPVSINFSYYVSVIPNNLEATLFNLKVVGIYMTNFSTVNSNQQKYGVLTSKDTFDKMYNTCKNYLLSDDFVSNSSQQDYNEGYLFSEGKSLRFSSGIENYAMAIYVSESLRNEDFSLILNHYVIPKESIPNIIYSSNLVANGYCFSQYYLDYLNMYLDLISSVYLKDAGSTTSVASLFVSHGFIANEAKARINGSIFQNISVILNVVIAILTFIGFFVIYYILYTITRVLILLVLGSKKKDCTIFETLGFTRRDVIQINDIEIMSDSLFAALVTYIGLFLLFLYNPGNIANYFPLIPVLSNPLFIVVYFVVVAFLSLMIGKKFKEKIYSQSIVKSLRDGSFLW